MIPGQNYIISPEAIAYKLASLSQFKTPKFQEQARALPRLTELLWAIQWFSMQPGALVSFAENFLATFPRRIGTPTMNRLQKNNQCTARECAAIIGEIPRHACWDRDPAAGFAHAFFERESEKDKEWESNCIASARPCDLKQIDRSGHGLPRGQDGAGEQAGH